MTEPTPLQDLVAEVAAAYFSNSHVSPGEIPKVIYQIAASLAQIDQPDGTTLSGAPSVRASPSQERIKPMPGQIPRSISRKR